MEQTVGFRALVVRDNYLERINWYESSHHINFSSEHISSGYFDYKQLLMKGFCDKIGKFHANKTVKNSKNPILGGFNEGGCLFFGGIMRGKPNFLFNPNPFGPI